VGRGHPLRHHVGEALDAYTRLAHKTPFEVGAQLVVPPAEADDCDDLFESQCLLGRADDVAHTPAAPGDEDDLPTRGQPEPLARGVLRALLVELRQWEIMHARDDRALAAELAQPGDRLRPPGTETVAAC